MISAIWNSLKDALAELLARETRRMCFAERTMRPFTPLERVLRMPPQDCRRLAV